jgi:Flp pilus assembly protein TadD
MVLRESVNVVSEQPRGQARLPVWLPLLLVAATVAVYLNSFDGVFVLDDQRYIADNPRVHQLWPPWPLLVRRRPVVDLSLAANYALGGLDLWGYHAFNLLIHVCAALTLLGVVRKTLLREPLRERFEQASAYLAFLVALIWAVHPLQTQSVTYLIQRAESMMGLFYLLMLYCLLRGMDSARGGLWFAAAIAACALGMGSKAVMVTAPVVALLYDRAFLSPSWRRILRMRWGLYMGLAATWGILWASGLVWGVLATSRKVVGTVGFSYKGVSPLEYVSTEPGVILYYLRLAFWPHPLCLDYDWPVAESVGQIVIPAVVLVILLAATVWALVRRPRLGFLGAWFFIILAPTSSFIPLRDPLFEHRMYLSLASVVALVVIGGYTGWDRLSRRWKLSDARRRMITILLVAAVVATLGYGTIDRNRDYRDAVAMWTDVVIKRPKSDRARYNLGTALLNQDRPDEAATAYRQALQLNPRNGHAHYNLGKILSSKGETDRAFEHYVKALEANPNLAEAHNDLANILVRRGRSDLAMNHYREAVRVNPRYFQAYYNLGNVLRALGEIDGAVDALERAVQLSPETAGMHHALGLAYREQGKIDEAIRELREALELDIGQVGARQALDSILEETSRAPQP